MIKKIMIGIVILVLILILILFFMVNYKPYHVKKFDSETLGVKQATGNQQTVSIEDFLKPSSMITLESIHSGNLKVPLSNPLNLKHPASVGIKNEEVVIPVFAYLIHHEKYGDFLIDSGCASSYENDAYGPMRGLILRKVMPETQLEKGQAIEEHLRDRISQIRGIFFTHLHFDHTSGLPAFSCNIPMIAGKGESSYDIRWLLEPHHFKKGSILYQLDFDEQTSVDTPVGKAIDLFGDNTMFAISTPGHSKGHVSYMINTIEGPVLVAGDAVIMNKSLELGVASGTSSQDQKQDQNTLERIISFSRENPQLKIMPGHDFMK